LSKLSPSSPDARVLVGNQTHDDAGVFQLNPEMALVQTVDFFTPVVDDPRQYGAIAAINALSDVWAMGGTPLTALNLLAVPVDSMPAENVARILQGGAEVMQRFGVSLIGGHSIDDPEPKVGYAVTGVVHPQQVWRNSTAHPGDDLYCTKPIGTGVLIKAIKDGVAPKEWVDPAIAMMLEANHQAKTALAAVGGPSSCTDITGFGLLGHSLEMALGAGVSVRIEASQVPILAGAEILAEKGAFPRGSLKNRDYVTDYLGLANLPEHRITLLCDAVTSGGLLFTVPRSRSEALAEAFRQSHIPLWHIGHINPGPAALEVVA
jgi:selenide,water dikinase